MIDEREPVGRLTPASAARPGRRPRVAAAHLVEHDEDPAADDDPLIDPLDERESRCALRVPRT